MILNLEVRHLMLKMYFFPASSREIKTNEVSTWSKHEEIPRTSRKGEVKYNNDRKGHVIIE